MKKQCLDSLQNAEIGKNVEIYAENFQTSGPFKIGNDVRIEAKNVFLGDGLTLERGVLIKGLGSVMETFSTGTESFIGFDSQILAPFFKMGDYSSIHNHALVSGYQPFSMGHNCWVGQNSILNCTAELKVGNNVRIGTQSQLWTHVASGELLEGCILFGEKPLTLEDNVWIVGGAVISPGLTLAKNSIIMTHSVVTKSTKPFHSYAGIPAKDITDKLNCWKEVNSIEKREMLEKFVCEFRNSLRQEMNRVFLSWKDDFQPDKNVKSGVLLFVDDGLENYQSFDENISIFDLKTKNYIKRGTELEKKWMKFAVGYRARFLPVFEL